MSDTPLMVTGSSAIPESTKRAINILSDLSIPIYISERNKGLEQIGTAFVLCRKNRRFLVTAAHCVNNILKINADRHYSAAVVLGFGSQVYTVLQPMPFIVSTDNKNNPDRTLDVGTLEITTGFDFSKHAMSSETCSSRAFCHTLPSDRVSVLGYPNKLNKTPIVDGPDGGKIVDAGMQAHVAYKLNSLFDLSKIGKCKSIHAAIEWPKKDVGGNMASIPRGLSGAPVWCMPLSPEFPASASDAIVVGVFNAYYKIHNVAVYTRSTQLNNFIDYTYFR